MKVYAMLLGLVLTLGSGYTAQMAVSSVGAGNARGATPAPDTRATDALDTVWYGGVLDPITVEARAPAKTAGTSRLLLDRPAVRCSRVSHTSQAVL